MQKRTPMNRCIIRSFFGGSVAPTSQRPARTHPGHTLCSRVSVTPGRMKTPMNRCIIRNFFGSSMTRPHRGQLQLPLVTRNCSRASVTPVQKRTPMNRRGFCGFFGDSIAPASQRPATTFCCGTCARHLVISRCSVVHCWRGAPDKRRPKWIRRPAPLESPQTRAWMRLRG